MMSKIQFLLGILWLACLVCIFSGRTLASSTWVKPKSSATDIEILDFWTGYSFFKSPWVIAPATTLARDGLGPLFNARSCDACHLNGAAGTTKADSLAFVIRIANDDRSGESVIARYGQQLQLFSVEQVASKTRIAPEVNLDILWEDLHINVGEYSFAVRKPVLQLSEFAYGEFPKDTPLSFRLAPALFGLGLIDQISEAEILSRHDPEDKNGDGISGRANYVVDVLTQKKSLGRFGHKNEQPNLLQQVASAFHADIGISSKLFPEQHCAEKQIACAKAMTGNSGRENLEIPTPKLQLVHTFSRLLRAVKNTNPPDTQGEKLFKSIGCHSCHVESMKLDGPSGQLANIYSDLLLHDMGSGLSDSRSYAGVAPSEWRTTPLWGLSRKLKKEPVSLLHDGRARSIREAVYWHGGEAENSMKQFFDLSKKEQSFVSEFLSRL